jgi:hypothetical protein
MSNAGTGNLNSGPGESGWVPAGTQFNGAVNTKLMSGSSRRGLKAKTLKRILKKAGLKVSGKKATLRARAKKARLVRGGAPGLGVVSATEQGAPATGGSHHRHRSRHRSRSLFRKFF